MQLCNYYVCSTSMNDKVCIYMYMNVYNYEQHWYNNIMLQKYDND